MTNPEKTISTTPLRGTKDVLPGETELWQELEALARKTLTSAGYKEIRTPMFEQTELFKRSAGEGSDIVGKEMYTFADKNGRSLTLRPEGTAAAARAYLNSAMGRLSPPAKLFYMGPFFRYEAVQTGRYRQFNQLGLEAFGSASPFMDAEVISVAVEFLKQAGLRDFVVQINSIGCADCRPGYRQLLKQSLQDQVPTLCVDCQDRFERNPLRMLDCKVEADQEQFKAMPAPLDSLCANCESQWLTLTQALKQLEIPFAVNKRLVRGLDYYTRTVFEVVSQDERLGANSTVAAGGRYDNLVESLGGPATPAVGWAVGLERLILLLDKQDTTNVDVYVVSTQLDVALQIATTLRRAGISADLDFPATGVVSRSSNKQFERAKKQGCRLLVKFGEDGQAADEITIKDMRSRKEISVFVSDVAEKVKEILLSDTGIT